MNPKLKLRYRAFTLLELLVSLSVIALLAALILPAVQYAREGARAAACRNNLKQIGIALSAYDESFGRWPCPGTVPYIDARASVHAQLLPFLGETAIYEVINFSLPMVERPKTAPLYAQADRWRISTFVCPSDAACVTGIKNSYRVNHGSLAAFNVWQDQGLTGPMQMDREVKARDTLDGLSKTAFMSERLCGYGGEGTFDRTRDIWWPEPGFGGLARSADFFRELCPLAPSLNQGRGVYTGLGDGWLSAGIKSTWYNHVLTPNSLVPDCLKAVEIWGADGAVSARSAHPGGVHVLTCDGTVQFVASAVDAPVWYALGTRANND